MVSSKPSASIAPSTAHFLKDKKISIVFRHWIPFNLVHSGKTHPLSCNQLRRRFRVRLVGRSSRAISQRLSTCLSSHSTKRIKNAFSTTAPAGSSQSTDISIVAVFPAAACNGGSKNRSFAPKLSVGTPGSKELYRLLREILNAPTKQPTAASDFPIPTKLLDSDLWLIVPTAHIDRRSRLKRPFRFQILRSLKSRGIRRKTEILK